MTQTNRAASKPEASSHVADGESHVGGPSRDSREGTRHIALYIPELIGGGVEKRTLSLAAALAERGHRVDLVLCES